MHTTRYYTNGPDVTVIHNGDWSGKINVQWKIDAEGKVDRYGSREGGEFKSGTWEIRNVHQLLCGDFSSFEDTAGKPVPLDVVARAVAITCRRYYGQQVVRLGESF